ncbi:MAG: hypothetical protein QM820_38890 [Minicystis sp.]
MTDQRNQDAAAADMCLVPGWVRPSATRSLEGAAGGRAGNPAIRSERGFRYEVLPILQAVTRD